MAGASLLALIDDIASVLDDVALLTKAAAKKTAGVLGDDLALNAQQVTGVADDRELPVVWAVAKGSLLNKAILVPLALAISTFAPWAVTPLLMIGGAFLCYEGAEKLAHRFLHRAGVRRALASEDLAAFERGKIRGAIRTDFVLSAEIIAIALGTVAGAPWSTQLGVLVTVALAMTVGVYGFVAGVVKLDDAGRHLARSASAAARAIGAALLRLAPWLMKALSVAGTAAMFLVGGGILAHGVPALGHGVERLAEQVAAQPGIGWAAALLPSRLGAALGVVAGAVVLGAVTAAGRVRARMRAG